MFAKSLKLIPERLDTVADRPKRLVRTLAVCRFTQDEVKGKGG